MVQTEPTKHRKHKCKENENKWPVKPGGVDAESTATPVTQKMLRGMTYTNKEKRKEVVLVETRQIPENILRTPV